MFFMHDYVVLEMYSVLFCQIWVGGGNDVEHKGVSKVILNDIVFKIRVCVWEKALLWGESEYPSLGTLNMGVGVVHAYLNLGIKD